MLKNAVLPVCLLFCAILISCAKDAVYDREAQLQLDVDSIARFIKTNEIGAKKDETGLYYQILRTGTGTVQLKDTDTLTVTYTGRLLNGLSFDRTELPVKLVYSGLIEGWKIGIQKIQQGGQIRLIIPSAMAYTDKQVGLIPPNSNLDYTIELLKISELKETTTNK